MGDVVGWNQQCEPCQTTSRLYQPYFILRAFCAIDFVNLSQGEILAIQSLSAGLLPGKQYIIIHCNLPHHPDSFAAQTTENPIAAIAIR